MLWISLCDSLSISSWGNSTSFRVREREGEEEVEGGGRGGEWGSSNKRR